MALPTLLVTHTVPPEPTEAIVAAVEERLPDLPVLTATVPEETDDLLDRADALVTGRLSEDLAERAGQAGVRWVQALSSGVDTYPRETLEAADIALTNAAGIHAEPIGEQVLGYMLAFERRFLDHFESAERNSWERVEGGELKDKTVGIVGVGAIGTRVAELCQAFGMEVLGTKRDPSTMPDAVDEGFPAEAYRELCLRSDYLVLSCPLTDETEGLLTMDEFRLMPGDSVLVNVARGAVCDGDDLLRALQEDVIRGAALDVFETEPLPADSRLWDLSNTLLTPHMAGSTPKKPGRWADVVVENARRLDRGEGLVNRVD